MGAAEGAFMWVSGEVRASQEETLLKAPSRALWRYWQTVRAGRSSPARGDLDLRQLRGLMPFLFIAAQTRPMGCYVWRLAGTGLCDLHRRELTGSSLMSGWENFERKVIQRFLAGVTGRHKQALLHLAFLTERGQRIDADMLALPLIAADGASTHVFGGLFPRSNQEIRPYESLTPLEVSFARFLEPASADVSSQQAETQAPRKFQVISGGRDHS